MTEQRSRSNLIFTENICKKDIVTVNQRSNANLIFCYMLNCNITVFPFPLSSNSHIFWIFILSFHLSPSSLTQFLSLSSVWEYRKYTTIKDQREKSEIARLLTSIADITAVYISENTSGKYCLIAGQGGTLIKHSYYKEWVSRQHI